VTSTITETEIDGVHTVVAPRSTTARLAAGLFFRVGRADETLATAGITHLVEHLALHDHGVGDLHYNGATADGYTHFHVEGTADHVVEYLNGVCAALRNLPVHRLETEKEILRTEAAGRGSGPAPQAPMYRYGSEGYGLSTFYELGLPRLDAAAVREWAATHFTRENAVLWIAGNEVPTGLDLTLPSGQRNPEPAVTSALPSTPAWYGAPGDAVYVSGIVDRSCAAMLYTRVLAKALFQDLRQKGGLSYQATANYTPRDRDHAMIELHADCLPEKRDAVIGGVIDTLARIRVGTITEAELESARGSAMQQFDVPDWEAQALPGYAINILVGKENITREQAEAEFRATTTAEIQAVARQFHDTALAQVPALGLDWAGFVQAPEKSENRLTGKEFASRNKDDSSVVVGVEGLSIISPGNLVTVKYADVVAMQAYPDGARTLFGRDGFRIHLEPTIFPVSRQMLAEIDAAVPASAVVTLPARDPEDIPKPSPQIPLTSHSPRPSVGSVIIWWCLAIIFLLAAISATSDYLKKDPDMDLANLVGSWVIFTGIAGYTSYRHLRRRAMS